MKVVLYKGKGLRNWHIRLVAANGKILASSEGYFSKGNAKRAATRMFPTLDVEELPPYS
jgi:uncharacterized protein YegP (UPF0339 family)